MDFIAFLSEGVTASACRCLRGVWNALAVVPARIAAKYGRFDKLTQRDERLLQISDISSAPEPDGGVRG
jgi:hypothetical protein